MSLFERFDRAYIEEDEAYVEDVKQAFNSRLSLQRASLFKEYVYYAFPERTYNQPAAVEFFLWLKALGVTL